jgi:asparagine synthase (glutamine-hydrolysing)
MSGFAGIIAADREDCDRLLLERWAEVLQYHGPDRTSLRIEPGAGFCFTFLKTGPAPQTAQQPFSLDGRIWLIGDVRLDAREELRRKLRIACGELPASATDEDLILLSWRAWGEAGIDRLLGDFAFALWNSEARHLLCVRDLMGGKPLFYALVNNCFYFSNSLSVLRKAPGLSQDLDEVFVGDFLLQEWCLDAERTVYKHLRRLPPGFILSYSENRIALRRYAELPMEEPLALKRPEEYVQGFRTLLHEAVQDRLPHGPCTIFLSGGLDSTSVAATASQIVASDRGRGDLRALTVDCRPLFADEEAGFASIAAKRLGLPIEILPRPACLPYDGWDHRELCTPEPYNDPLLLAGQLQYQKAASHSRVVLTGYGGDDILTGQAWPFLVYLLRRRKLAAATRAFGAYLWKHKRLPPLRGGFRGKLFGWLKHDDVPVFPGWLAPRFSQQYALRDRWEEMHKPPANPHPWHPIAYALLRSHFWSTWFEAEEPEWTRQPVQLRSPLLDQRVIRYLLRLPPVPWCMHKHLLRQAMRGSLPEEILARRKTPFLGDPLVLLRASGRWQPSAPAEPAEAVRPFVDWCSLSKILDNAKDSSIWEALRPISLHHWANSIEKADLIR